MLLTALLYTLKMVCLATMGLDFEHMIKARAHREG
jgi:hypothetical protein